MTTAKGIIEKYVGGNVHFFGREAPLFIPPGDIKAAQKNFPEGRGVKYSYEKGTVKGMDLLPEDEEAAMKAELEKKMATEPPKPPAPGTPTVKPVTKGPTIAERNAATKSDDIPVGCQKCAHFFRDHISQRPGCKTNNPFDPKCPVWKDLLGKERAEKPKEEKPAKTEPAAKKEPEAVAKHPQDTATKVSASAETTKKVDKPATDTKSPQNAAMNLSDPSTTDKEPPELNAETLKILTVAAGAPDTVWQALARDQPELFDKFVLRFGGKIDIIDHVNAIERTGEFYSLEEAAKMLGIPQATVEDDTNAVELEMTVQADKYRPFHMKMTGTGSKTFPKKFWDEFQTQADEAVRISKRFPRYD